MRTTLAIDKLLAAARTIAERTGGGLGSALSELARRGFKSAPTMRIDGDPTVFAVDGDSETITSEDVYRSLGEWR